MKILSLVWFKVLPANFGGQKGIALFNEHLAAHASLVCLCSSNNKTTGNLPYSVRPELPYSKQQFLSPSVWKKIVRVAKEEKPQLLILEFPYHAIAAFLVKQFCGASIVLHQHNIEYKRFRALGKWWWPLLRAYERWACRMSALVLVKTEEDRQHAIEQLGCPPAKTMVVPYGVERFTKGDPKVIRRQWGIEEGKVVLLFAGTLDYEPNARAVADIHEHLAPALDRTGLKYSIIICGRNREASYQWLNKLHHPNVIMAGEVPSIEPYFDAADVFLNPVLSGGGIQTKILDALAHHCSVVAFNFATRGIDASVTSSKVQTVPDGDWQSFAAAVEGSWSRKTDTPEAFFDHYSWAGITRKVYSRLKQLMS